MRTIRLQYLQKKLPQKLKFKALFLTFVLSLFLSACGIKGDLYQTPEQPVTEKEMTVIDANKAQNNSNNSHELEKQSVVEQVIEHPADPVLEPALDSVKSHNNVS